jgi:YVTN family beta-propeller protein
MRRTGWWGAAALGLGLAVVAGQQALIAQRSNRRVNQESVNSAAFRESAQIRPDNDVLFNGWGLTPAGQTVPLGGDLPLKMIVAPDGKTVIAITGGFNGTGLTVLDLKEKQVTQTIPLARAWNGLALSSDGTRLWASSGAGEQIYPFTLEDGKLTAGKSVFPDPQSPAVFLAGIAVHPRTGKLYVCNEANHEIWVLNAETLKREASIPVGLHPHSCVFGADRRHLYVSNWGSRSVSVVDTQSGRRLRDIGVGVRPNDMAVGKDGRLFVACSGDNTVHVIQTQALEQAEAPADPSRRPPEGVREIISTSLYPASPEGSTPDGVAVSPDGKTLYVANADNNDVMVADISEAETTRVLGFIPTGWYPSAVAVSPDGATVLIGNGKGLRSAANHPARTTPQVTLHKPPPFDYIGRLLQGSVSFIGRPDLQQMMSYTDQVRRNSPYTPEALQRAPISSDIVIPDRVGESCPIKYVLYVIKENRTYDQVFGNFRDAKGNPAGNGDPSLVMFGESISPNHHQLARDYVLLDNLYCNGEVSVDGHSWCDAAIATDANQRSWLMSYSGHGKLPSNDEMMVPTAGFLWDLCKRHGVPFKCYGEGASRVPSANRGTWPPGRDKDRIDGWIRDLKAAEITGELPRFMIMSLGEDHTSGRTPGKPTPDASFASNDLALGKLVEAASRSKFWKEMAIFVIEDDAQNGPDHVDSHRTVGLVIGPHVKRGIVDSTLYTTASMIRTMELILGLPPLTQYDAGATPMFACFGKRAQSTPYTAKTPQVDLNAMNPGGTADAKLSSTMDFDEYDRAPEDELNQVLWRWKFGTKVPYRAPIHRFMMTTRR